MEQTESERDDFSHHRAIAVCGDMANIPLTPERGFADCPDERCDPAASAQAGGNPQCPPLFRHYTVPGFRGLRRLCRTTAELAISIVTHRDAPASVHVASMRPSVDSMHRSAGETPSAKVGRVAIASGVSSPHVALSHHAGVRDSRRCDHQPKLRALSALTPSWVVVAVPA